MPDMKNLGWGMVHSWNYGAESDQSSFWKLIHNLFYAKPRFFFHS